MMTILHACGLLRLLEDNGHEVVTASNNNQGLGFLKSWRPELIFVALWREAITISLEFINSSKTLGTKAKFWLLWSDADYEIAYCERFRSGTGYLEIRFDPSAQRGVDYKVNRKLDQCSASFF